MNTVREGRTPGIADKLLRCVCAAALAGMALPSLGLWAVDDAYAADGDGTSYEAATDKVQAVAGEAQTTGKKVLLKQLMADTNELGDVSTIKGLYELENYQETIVTQYAAEADVYEADGKYYADLGAASDRGMGEVLDWAAIADDDAFDPEDISTFVDVNCESGLAEIDPSAFQEGKTPVVQTLVAVSPDAIAECGVDVEVENDGTRCTAQAKAQTVACDTLDMTTTVPVATAATADGVTLEDLEVHLNGSEDIYALVDGETAVWDTETGELTIAESPSVVKNVSVKVSSKGIVERLFAAEPAYASTKNADDLNCLRGVDGRRMELTSINRDKFATGQLYTYDTYIAVIDRNLSSSSVTAVSIRNSIKNTVRFNYLPTNSSAQTVIDANYKSKSWNEYTSKVGAVAKLSNLSNTYLADFAFTPPRTATSTGGKTQNFRGFSRTSKASTSYYKNHLLSAACIDIANGAATNPTGNTAKNIKEGESGAWGYAKGTMSMRVLKFDASANYAIMSFVMPTMWGQAGNAVYKVKVAEEPAEDAAIAVVKKSSNEGLTENSKSYSLEDAIFGVFKTKKKANAAVKAAAAGSMADDDAATDDSEDYDENANEDDTDTEDIGSDDEAATSTDDAKAETFDWEEYIRRNGEGYTSTNAKGECNRLCDNLPKYSNKNKKTLATYYVVELAAPKGFELSSEIKTVKVKESTSNDNPVTVTFTDDPGITNVGVYKSITNPEMCEGNPNYSLEGTTFGVYTTEEAAEADSDGTAALRTITVAETSDGRWYAEATGLALGTYWIKETKAAEGFEIDLTAYKVDAMTPGTHLVENTQTEDKSVGNNIQGDPLIIKKYDSDTGEAFAQGGASLARAQFTIRHYVIDVDANQTADSLAKLTPDAEWIVQLNGEGEFRFQDINKTFDWEGNEIPYLIASSYDGVTDTEARLADGYINTEGIAQIPYGWVTVEETKAPQGYQIDSGVHVIKMTIGTTEAQLTVACYDEIIRGDITLQKATDDGSPLAHVPFRITNKTTGEKHIIVTDENGRFDSATATNTNNAENDNDNFTFAAEAAAALMGDTTVDDTDGCWFGALTGGTIADEDDSKGAFQYGSYTIEELPSPANWGQKLIEPFDFEVDGDVTGLVYDQGTIIDKTIRIGTTATDTATGSKDVTIGHDASITDDVELINLNDNTDYLLTATLMDKATGLPVEDADGESVTASTEITTGEDTPETMMESIELTFDTALIDRDAELVVFERLTDEGRPEYNEPVAVHEDLDDEGQTVKLNGIHTTATDKTDGDKVLLNSETAKIVDTVEYVGLKEGVGYTMKATLIDADGDEVDGNGEAKFTAKSSGTVDVTVELDASKMADGDAVTVFEELYEDGEDVPVTTHEEVGDEGQTVNFTSVPTVVPGTPDADTPKTGADVTWAAIVAVLAAAAAATCAVVAVVRRKKPKPTHGGWNG